MKKVIASLSALLLAFALVACDDGDDPTEAPAESPAVESPEVEE